MSSKLVETFDRGGVFLGLSTAELLLVGLVPATIGMAFLYSDQLSPPRIAVPFSEVGTRKVGVPTGAISQNTGTKVESRAEAEQRLRLNALETALQGSRRDIEEKSVELAELRQLKALYDDAARIDANNSPVVVMQRALTTLRALSALGEDPVQAARNLVAENEELQRKLAQGAGANRREQEAALRDLKRDNEALKAELAALKPYRDLANAAAKLDSRQPPVAVLQRSLAALEALGPANGDPARQVREMKAESDTLRKRAASDAAELAQYKSIAEMAARVDAKRPPAAVVQRALTALAALKDRPGDPAEAIQSLQTENEELRISLLSSSRELDQARAEVKAQIDTSLAAARREQETLRAEVAQLAQFKPLAERAAKLAPGQSPAAVLQRALDAAEPRAAARDIVQSAYPLSAWREIDRVLAYSPERDANEGAARSEPARRTARACWRNERGETQFLFDITIKDNGLNVRNAVSPDRASDANLKLVEGLPRGVDIDAETFRRSVTPLFRQSVRDGCRYVVRLFDETGPLKKQAYKEWRRLVEGHFFARHM